MTVRAAGRDVASGPGAAPQAGPPEALPAVRRAFAEASYGEAGVRAAFDGRTLQQLRGLGRPTLERRVGGDSALALLLRLFAAELAVPASELRSRLGAPAVEGLLACGMATEDGGSLRARVSVEPFGDLLICADRRGRHGSAADDYVPVPGPGTRRLAEHAVPAAGARLLDLGCGSGALSLAAAARGAVVTGVDVSKRAIAFARFNAALNGQEGVELLVGDLFAPVAGRRFDRVLCNPPYVISPARRFAYRDGPPDVCSRIVAGLRTHLEPGGVAQVLCNWPRRRGRDWREDLAGWFEGGGCDALVLADEGADVLDYATLWLLQEHESESGVAAHLDQWLDFYAREGIEGVSAGMLVLRRVEHRPPWLDIRATPASRGPGGASLTGLFEARDRLLGVSRPEELLDLRLCRAPGLELVERRATAGEAWDTPVCELRLARGFAFAARVDPVAAAIAGALDGTRTLREAAAAVAARGGVSVQALTPGLPGLARQLMALGLLRESSPLRPGSSGA